jgi:hypothetical protein
MSMPASSSSSRETVSSVPNLWDRSVRDDVAGLLTANAAASAVADPVENPVCVGTLMSSPPAVFRMV